MYRSAGLKVCTSAAMITPQQLLSSLVETVRKGPPVLPATSDLMRRSVRQRICTQVYGLTDPAVKADYVQPRDCSPDMQSGLPFEPGYAELNRQVVSVRLHGWWVCVRAGDQLRREELKACCIVMAYVTAIRWRSPDGRHAACGGSAAAAGRACPPSCCTWLHELIESSLLHFVKDHQSGAGFASLLQSRPRAFKLNFNFRT